MSPAELNLYQSGALVERVRTRLVQSGAVVELRQFEGLSAQEMDVLIRRERGGE